MTGKRNTELRRIGRPALGLGIVACLVLALVSAWTPAPSRTAGSAELKGSAVVVAAASGVQRTATRVSVGARPAAHAADRLAESASGYGLTLGSFPVCELAVTNEVQRRTGPGSSIDPSSPRQTGGGGAPIVARPEQYTSRMPPRPDNGPHSSIDPSAPTATGGGGAPVVHSCVTSPGLGRSGW